MGTRLEGVWFGFEVADAEARRSLQADKVAGRGGKPDRKAEKESVLRLARSGPDIQVGRVEVVVELEERLERCLLGLEAECAGVTGE